MAANFLIRQYTGKEAGFVSEMVVFNRGEQIALIPISATKAVQVGQELTARGVNWLVKRNNVRTGLNE